ncbi:DUF637 domain-containing protein [Ruegeria sp. Ofav3-42]|uniref:DUF637 domain-containing protein n=1 Tax=Ruegeria sp. Ofav3-42 TaxID=2917759 RepID=UPI001EF55D55|nr:DUF637 domain-containing protein [Ruegeria sp. Ofav3-42]MCG7521618.1 DUF637 domain-containing protein [Ruegeria sp. Ofav3-42]
MSVTAADQAKISGELVAGKGLTLKSTAAGIAVETNAEILAESLNVEAQTRIDFDGKAAAHETASVSAGTELATGADSELLADSVALTGETAQLSGELRAVDRLTIEATDGAVEHSGVSRGQNVSIIGDTVETGDTSQIAAVDGLTVTATDQILLDGELASEAELAITSTGASVTIEDGTEMVADALNVDAQTHVALNGRVAVQNRAELKAGASLTTGDASEIVAGSIAFSGTTALIAGQAEAQDSVSIEARDGTLEHAGRSRGRSVTLSGDRVQTGNSSQIAAIADLQVTATDRAVIDGTMIAGQRADLSVKAGDLDLQGQINARNTNITASGQTNLGAEALAVGQSVLELQSGSLNGGLRASHFDQLRAGDGLAVTLETGGLTVAASERVEFDGDLLLDLDGDLENRGTIKASGDLQLRSGSDLNNRGGLLKSGETMQLVARDGTVLNQSGRIEADGGLAIEAETFINRFDSVSTQTATSGVEIFAGTPDNKTRSRTVSTDPADLKLASCSKGIIPNSYTSNNCATIYNFGISDQSNIGGVTWSSGTSVTTTGARPEILSGAGIAIQAKTVRNDAGLISSAAGTTIQSNRFENTAYEDDRVTHSATYTRRTEVIDHGNSDASIRAYEYINYSAVERVESSGASSVLGEILAGGAISINGSTVHADGNIKAGTASVVPPRENSNVTQTSLPDLIVPAASLAPVQPDVLDLPALAPVQPDVVNLPPLDPVQPKLQTLANLDALIGEGRTNFGTMRVSYDDLLSSDHFLDRLQIQDELFQNINRPTEWNGYQSDGVSFEGGSAVQIPNSEFIGFGDRFGLSESGVLASLDKANKSESGDLKITAGSITGSGGLLIAEDGTLSLTSFGNISFEDTGLGGDLIKIIAGGDFSGKALVIKSRSDTSIFAAGNVTIEGLAQTEEYYTNTSVTKITENLASRFDVGGDLSIISSADMTLAGVQAQVTGDTRLTAGGGLYLLAEQSGVQYSEGDAKNGTDRLTLTAQVTQLSTGGDFIANAGGDAVLVGTQIDAGGKVHLAAAGDIVLAAAQDIAKSEIRKTSRGFLSKKKETRSTLAVTNRGVGITAGDDIDIIAETGDLTTAGTELASASGDINLTATEGNILVGTYTDVFEETHIKEKSYLGGLLSKSSQLHTVDHINTGTDALAALDLSIVSGSDTTLVGATLSAGQNLNITTGGDFSVRAAIDSHRSEFFETDMGLVTMTTITETSFTETAVLTELLAGQGMSFEIGGNAELVVYQTAGVDAPNPQDLYPEELLAIDGLELISQELADEYFYDKKTQLSPAFKALVAIVVAAYVPGIVAGLGQTVTATTAAGATTTTTSIAGITTATTTASGIHLTAVGQGLSAAISSATVSTLDGVVSGNLDLGEILETATFSGLTAGLTAGINLDDIVGKIPEGSPLNDALLGNFGNGNLTIAGVLEGTIDGAISSGLSSAVYGTDFSDNFTAGLATTLVNLATADAQNVIGGTFEAGSAGNLLGHSLLGCLQAEATGADCASGIAGALSEQAYVAAVGGTIPQIGTDEYQAWKDQHSQSIELVGAAVGFVFSGGEAENVNSASSYAVSAFQNNYLTSAQRAEVERLLAEKNELLGGECQIDATRCEAIEKRLAELELESALNTLDLEQACKSSLTSAACTAHVNEARNYIAWADANGHRFDVNIGQFYHPGLLGQGKAGLDQSIIQAIEEKPQVTSLDDLRDTVHKLNQAGRFTGLFGEADDLKRQGQLMDEFGRLNDKNDPLVQVPCGRSPVPCYSNRRSKIRGELLAYGIKDFFVPRTIGGVIFEVGTAGAGTLVKFGGKTFLRVGDNLLEATADGAGGYKVATNRIVPDEILDQADLDRFANLRNDLGLTSNNQLRRNVAVGEGYVDGVNIGEIIGVSGRRGPGVEMPENPIFTTTTVGHPRNLDSEVFVLENLAQRLTPQSTGTIRLLSERTVCASCQGVITQFREMFPNINLIVRSGSQ